MLEQGKATDREVILTWLELWSVLGRTRVVVLYIDRAVVLYIDRVVVLYIDCVVVLYIDSCP